MLPPSSMLLWSLPLVPDWGWWREVDGRESFETVGLFLLMAGIVVFVFQNLEGHVGVGWLVGSPLVLGSVAGAYWLWPEVLYNPVVGIGVCLAGLVAALAVALSIPTTVVLVVGEVRQERKTRQEQEAAGEVVPTGWRSDFDLAGASFMFAAREAWLAQWENDHRDWCGEDGDSETLGDSRVRAAHLFPLDVDVVTNGGDLIIPGRKHYRGKQPILTVETTLFGGARLNRWCKRSVEDPEQPDSFMFVDGECVPGCACECRHLLPDENRSYEHALARCPKCAQWFYIKRWATELGLFNAWEPVTPWHRRFLRAITRAEQPVGQGQSATMQP